MKVHLNGNAVDVAAATLSGIVDELGYDGAVVATAVNKTFVPRPKRRDTAVRDGDAIEVIMPMKGG
jgi:sulfur carrier protein